MICQKCGNNVGNRMKVCPYCGTPTDPAAAEHAARMSAPTNPLGRAPVRDARQDGPSPYAKGRPGGGCWRFFKTLFGILACAAVLVGVAYGTWRIGLWGGMEVPTGLIGMDAAVAEGVLSSHGFKVSTVEQTSADAAGEVLAVDPAEGQRTGFDRAVTLTVGIPDPDAGKLTVPDVLGLSADEARASLEAAGFAVGTEEVDSDSPEGSVASMAPGAGSLAEPGSTVMLGIARKKLPATPSDIFRIADYFSFPSATIDSWLRGQGLAEPKTSNVAHDALYAGEGITVGFSEAYPSSLLGVYTGGDEIIRTQIMSEGFDFASARVVYAEPGLVADKAAIEAAMQKCGLTGLETVKTGEEVSAEYGWSLEDQIFAVGSMDGRSWAIDIDPSAGEVRVAMFPTGMGSTEVSAESVIDLAALANNL